MVIANGDQVDVIMDIMSGKEKGTLFLAHPNLDFDLMHYLNNEYKMLWQNYSNIIKE